jgi:hypothetical protein
MASNHFTLPFVMDRWIALSSLQKSMRRGEIGYATAAAEVLWHEPSRLLDRLLVIGLEDIGVGDLEVLSEVIERTTDRAWRRGLPDKGRAATLELVGRMCSTTKSRFTDELTAIAALEPALETTRQAFATLSDQLLVQELAHGQDIGARGLAAWFLAGTDRYRMDALPRRRGNLTALWQVYRTLGAPDHLLRLLDRAARRMPWPLAVLLPLANVSLASSETGELVQNTPFETHRGLPLYALDQFTRRGLVAIGRWYASCPDLREVLRQGAPAPAPIKIIRYAVFAVESQVCDRHLMWPEQRDVLRRSMQAELTGRGLRPEVTDALLASAKANLPGLNNHRRQVMDEAP